jgi:hypothetical protein
MAAPMPRIAEAISARNFLASSIVMDKDMVVPSWQEQTTFTALPAESDSASSMLSSRKN